MTLFAAELTRVAPGEVDVELPFRGDFGQQNGLLHAGVLTSIADVACGYSALTLMPPGADVISVEFKLNLLAPGRGDRFIARGRVIRAGRTITVCRADVFAIASGNETLIATMLATMMQRTP
jgi:uncharacterized protein (TIGR00369 family)